MRNTDLYARLELISPESLTPGVVKPVSPVAPSRVSQIWTQLNARLRSTGRSLLRSWSGSMEPRITTKRDRHGANYFAVYDPIDGNHHTFHSETDVRAWLEQRYYL